MYLNSYETFGVCTPGCVSYLLISGERKNSAREVLSFFFTSSFPDNAFPMEKEEVLLFEAVHFAFSESLWFVCYSEIFPSCKQANFDLSVNSLFLHSSSSRQLTQLWAIAKSFAVTVVWFWVWGSSTVAGPLDVFLIVLHGLAVCATLFSRFAWNPGWLWRLKKEGYNYVKSKHLLESWMALGMSSSAGRSTNYSAQLSSARFTTVAPLRITNVSQWTWDSIVSQRAYFLLSLGGGGDDCGEEWEMWKAISGDLFELIYIMMCKTKPTNQPTIKTETGMASMIPLEAGLIKFWGRMSTQILSLSLTSLSQTMLTQNADGPANLACY